MIRKISNAITPEQAAELFDLHRKIAGQKLQRQHWNLPVIQHCLDLIEQVTGPFIVEHAPSYIALEQTTQGHPVHADGCVYTAKGWKPNHMAWCKWSASILVSDPALCSGGVVKFQDQSVTPAEHYCNLYVWSSHPESGYTPELHSVTPHSGCRVVLLFFLAVDYLPH